MHADVSERNDHVTEVMEHPDRCGGRQLRRLRHLALCRRPTAGRDAPGPP